MYTSDVAYIVYTAIIFIIILGIDELVHREPPAYILWPVGVVIWASFGTLVFHTLFEIPTIISTYIAAATLTLYIPLLAVSFLVRKPK